MNFSKNAKSLRFHKIKEDGFVLVTALMVIFLVLTIVTTVALVTASDMKASARARAIIKTRFVAESVSDTIYARIAGLRGGYLNEARNYGIVEGGSPTVGNNPLVPTSASDPWGSWFALDGNGALKTCEVKDVCFRAKMNQVRGGSLVVVTTRDEVSLDLIVRGGCYGDSLADLRGCVYRQFQTRYRTRSYIDTASIANKERSNLVGIPVDPADATKNVRVALLPSDVVSGAVQTNDPDGYLFCGQVNGVNELRYRNGGGSVTDLKQYLVSSNTSCDFASDPTAIGRPEVLLPSQVSTKGTSTYTATVYEHLAGSTHRFTAVAPSSISLQLNANDITLNGATSIKYPSNGVIYIEGNLNLNESQFGRSLTIYVRGNVLINGNIVDNGTDHLLGVASTGEMVINCARGSRCPERTIEAVLSSGLRIYNNAWDDSPVGAGAAPALNVKGALISDERPVFGSYLTTSNAMLVNGWQKNIMFDSRLLDNQPPFFFRTTQASIVRSSMDEGRCTEAFCS